MNVINVITDTPLSLVERVSKTIDLVQPLFFFYRKRWRLGHDARFSPLEARSPLVSIGLINSLRIGAAVLADLKSWSL
jgi:hypothetical protein